MEEGLIHQELVIITDDQAAEFAQPGEGALDLPPPSVAAQGASVLQGRFAATLAMRADQEDAAAGQPASTADRGRKLDPR